MLGKQTDGEEGGARKEVVKALKEREEGVGDREKKDMAGERKEKGDGQRERRKERQKDRVDLVQSCSRESGVTMTDVE